MGKNVQAMSTTPQRAAKEWPFRLPEPVSGHPASVLADVRQLTMIGANGAGKSRLMGTLLEEAADKGFILSALEGLQPLTDKARSSAAHNAVPGVYAGAVSQSPFLRRDASSQLEMLLFMIVNDECEALMRRKMVEMSGREVNGEQLTKLDRLAALWEGIFPGRTILRQTSQLTFSTESGADAVGVGRLSQGERAALYYMGGALYAPRGAVVFVESPTLFLHPSIAAPLWNAVERMRSDCRFVYNTYDLDFVMTRSHGMTLWVKSYDATANRWDYEPIDTTRQGSGVLMSLATTMAGARRPILLIEGDEVHSLDVRLYSLVFEEMTVRPMGSCDKVIETTRTLNDVSGFHRLESRGLVDRDRRTDAEVGYLIRKRIMVPDVAEVENLFLLEDVIRTMAEVCGRDGNVVFRRIKKELMQLWATHYEAQALEHTRYRTKRLMEYRADGRFRTISQLEDHIRRLAKIVNPRHIYDEILGQFRRMLEQGDYAGVLKVFNYKPALAECGLAAQLGCRDRDEYIRGVLRLLKSGGKNGRRLKNALRRVIEGNSQSQTKVTYSSVEE